MIVISKILPLLHEMLRHQFNYRLVHHIDFITLYLLQHVTALQRELFFVEISRAQPCFKLVRSPNFILEHSCQ